MLSVRRDRPIDVQKKKTINSTVDFACRRFFKEMNMSDSCFWVTFIPINENHISFIVIVSLIN